MAFKQELVSPIFIYIMKLWTFPLRRMLWNSCWHTLRNILYKRKETRFISHSISKLSRYLSFLKHLWYTYKNLNFHKSLMFPDKIGNREELWFKIPCNYTNKKNNLRYFRRGSLERHTTDTYNPSFVFPKQENIMSIGICIAKVLIPPLRVGKSDTTQTRPEQVVLVSIVFITIS